ncbi:MAG TPA: ATPase, partial [Lachnospiraceae bacterium]|nr:ATPase [Lachnospiraceae bacterium]
MEELPYRTNVTTGEALKKLLHHVRRYEKRDCFEKLHRYLYGSGYGRVCILYGLRRTGKTTLLFQAMAEMIPEDFAKAAYIKLRPTDEMDMAARDLDHLRKEGYQYIFLDEVTLMKDFVDSAALLSDIYAMMGMKIVLSGTDSLGFWIARDYELYDRECTIHTTFIPFREYSRLLGIDSIDEYIRYGGTLRAGELAFDDEDALASDAAFRDDENTRRYIDTAIAKNIQHSLECYEYGSHFYHLYPLYEKGELTGAINRVVEDMNHRFVLEVLTRDFVSHDLGISARNLRQDRNPEIRTRALYEIDRETVTKRLMDILEIRNQEEQTIGLNDGLVSLIKKYLKDLDLIVNCPIESAEAGLSPQEHMLFLQPGMRYCQAQ